MLKAVFYDMDGTITRPHIDWKALRRRIGVPEGIPIMAHIESLPPPESRQARTILERTEIEAAEAAKLNPGAAELVRELRAGPLRQVLITNNHRRAMLRVVEKFGLEFDLMLSREDGPLKPAPDLLILALERLGFAPEEACFVGDGYYDLAASRAAGVPYVHLAHDGEPAGEGYVIHSLHELWKYLEERGIER